MAYAEAGSVRVMCPDRHTTHDHRLTITGVREAIALGRAPGSEDIEITGVAGMTGFCGPDPMHGNAAQLMVDTFVAIITGKITSRGVLRDCRGSVALVLPEGDPSRRRHLERVGRYRYRLYDGGVLFYSSPDLQVHEIWRESDGLSW